MEKMRNLYKNVVGKPEKKQLGRSGHRWNYIKLHNNERGCDNVIAFI
jgi:hypothetical protein